MQKISKISFHFGCVTPCIKRLISMWSFDLTRWHKQRILSLSVWRFSWFPTKISRWLIQQWKNLWLFSIHRSYQDDSWKESEGSFHGSTGGLGFRFLEFPYERHWICSNYRDLTRPHPKWWFSKGNPLISGKPRLVKDYNLARLDSKGCPAKNPKPPILPL